jgi:outer membrane protein assembly factor BamB
MKKSGTILFAVIVITAFFFLLSVYPVGSDVDANKDITPGVITKGSIPSTEYPQFRGDAAKTGNSSATGPSTFNELWNKNYNRPPTYGSPTVQYDQVYFTYSGDSGQGTKCYDMSGNIKWSFNLGNSIGAPLIYDGKCYLSIASGDLYCLDANATGSQTTTTYWTYDAFTGAMDSSEGYYEGTGSPVTDGTMVYYSTMDPTGLHAVWLSNGTKAWTASLGGSKSTEASPTYWNGRVYCGGGSPWGIGNNNLYCFDATTGAKIWTFNTNGKACGTPAIVDSRLYIGSMDGKVYCLDADDTPALSTSPPTKHWEYSLGSTIYASPAVGYGRIYIGDTGTSTNFHCLEDMGTSAANRWTQSLTISNSGGYGICSSVAITADYVYTGTSGGDVYCRDRSDGSHVWSKTYTKGWYGCTSPAVYQDKVFISTDDAHLYAIGPLVDVIPPKVTANTPAKDEDNVAIDIQVSMIFNEPLDTGTVDGNSVFLKDSTGGNVAGQVTTNMATKTVFFTPDADLANEETYTLTITTDVMDTSANNLDGDGDGTAEGPGIDEYIFSFTTAPLYPPVIGAIPTLHPTEDVSYIMNLESIISDPDTPKDQLVLAETSDYATLAGFEMTLLYPEGVTNDLVNLSVNDGTFTVYKDIVVEVTSANDPPVVDPIPAQTCMEDVAKTLDMTDYITDLDTQLAEITLSDKSPFTEITGMEITFLYPEGVLEDLVNVTVYDKGLEAYAEIDVTVLPVNDAPEIGALNTAEATEDITLEYYVGGQVTDIDTPKEDLVIEVDSPYVEVNGFFLNLTYPNGIETDILDVKVYDGELYDNTSLEVLITSVNDAPVWTNTESIEISAKEDEPGEFDLEPYISDVDHETRLLRINSDSNYGNMDSFLFKFVYPNGVLFEAVTFTLTDGEESATLVGDVTVTPVNDAPELSAPAVSPKSGNGTTKFTFTVVFKDVDIGESRDALVKVHIDKQSYDCEKQAGSHKAGVKYQYITAIDDVGNHTFYFTADDLDGATATSDEGVVTVNKDEGTGGGGGGGEESSSSAGLLIGVGVAVVVFVILIIVAVVIVFVFMSKKKKAAADEAPPQETTPEGQGQVPQDMPAQQAYPQQQQYQQQDLYGGQTQTTDPYQQQYNNNGYNGSGYDQYNQQQQQQAQYYPEQQQQQQIQQPQQQQLPPATDSSGYYNNNGVAQEQQWP